jgi:hypothetical protein
MSDGRQALVLSDPVARHIHVIRGQKVMLDSALAALYGVSSKRLNEQVKRNRRRFPRDFMFRLNDVEARALRSQIATLNAGRGRHRKYRPHAFSELGAVMLASVLNSSVAVRASIQVVRAFVRWRAVLDADSELSRKLTVLERTYDQRFRLVFDAIRQLMHSPPIRRRRSGFHAHHRRER